MEELHDGRGVFVLPLAIITCICAAAFAGGCLSDSGGTNGAAGTLTGSVSIGPLCPVEPCTISRDQLTAAYAARPLIVSTPKGAEVARVTADPDDGYTIALNPGIYVVDIPHRGIGGSPDLPVTVTIRSGETVRLDISIDTGIR